MKEENKFIMAYSCGKDCTLALDEMISQGNIPVALLVCVRTSQHSHMHNIDVNVIKRYEDALGIPVLFYTSPRKHDTGPILEALTKAKELGATTLCTGDIDLDFVKEWNQMICDKAGLKLESPLWKRDRDLCLNQLIDKGYKAKICYITDHSLPEEFLGKTIDHELVEEMRKYNIDICGENGEYHSIMIDGPIFKHPIDVNIEETQSNEFDCWLNIK